MCLRDWPWAEWRGSRVFSVSALNGHLAQIGQQIVQLRLTQHRRREARHTAPSPKANRGQDTDQLAQERLVEIFGRVERPVQIGAHRRLAATIDRVAGRTVGHAYLHPPSLRTVRGRPGLDL